MATAAKEESSCWPLGKVTDGAHWDASDLFGRLCLVAHAAFLSAGFLPSDSSSAAASATPPPPPFSAVISRRYSLPQLSDRDGADAAVLCVSGRGRRRGGCGRGRIELYAYVDCGSGRYRNARCERLALAALAPVLSGDMAHTARALTTPDYDGGAWLWKLLADQLARRLFLSICHHAGVPSVLPSFACLPVDLQVGILRRLDAAEDVARAECAGRELRRLVADANHDDVLWKDKYERIRPDRKNKTYAHRSSSGGDFIMDRYERRRRPVESESGPPFFTDEDMAMMSWKERYAVARWQREVKETWETMGMGRTPMPAWRPRVPSAADRARLQTIVDMVRRRAQRWYSWQQRLRNNGPDHQPGPGSDHELLWGGIS